MKHNPKTQSVVLLTFLSLIGFISAQGQTLMHQGATATNIYSTNTTNEYMYREMYGVMMENNRIMQSQIGGLSAGNSGLSPAVSAETAKYMRLGRARIAAGQATIKFSEKSPAEIIKIYELSRGSYGSRAVTLFGKNRLDQKITDFLGEIRRYGYQTDDYVDVPLYAGAVIYEAFFGRFPTKEVMNRYRSWMTEITLKGEMLQGNVANFHKQSYEIMAAALLAREWKNVLETSANRNEINSAAESLDPFDKVFRQNIGKSIINFAEDNAKSRSPEESRKDGQFRRSSRHLAEVWYEKAYAAKFGRTDLEYAALLKEFDSIVTGMGGATNDGADGELAAAALVYEVYLDSQKVGYQLNENHLRDLREMIARNFAQPYWSEAADIWRQRDYEKVAARGMFVNKAYFSAKTPQQKKALADEALNVLKIVFRGKINEYYIDANGIGRR